MTPDSQAIIVLGMFRSGTSMTAGILSRLGVDMGEDVLEPSRANPTGYFEAKDFFQLSRNILRAAGGNAHEPPSRSSILAQEASFRRSIREAVAGRGASVWGWKDPSTCLTADLFLPVLPNPHVVVCIRNADDVAASYAKMVDLLPEQILDLRQIYNDRIEEFLADHPSLPVCQIEFGALTTEPERVIDRLIQSLKITVTPVQHRNACEFVLPASSIRWMRYKNLVRSGIERPGDILPYVKKRLFYFVERTAHR